MRSMLNLAFVGLCGMCAISACAFTLDFDELQSGKAPPLQAGGSAGSGGGSCASDCKDSDPCTRDFCDTLAVPAVCKHEPTPGLATDDGFAEAVLAAPTFHRVTMAAGSDRFYLSTFNGSEVALYRLPMTGTAIERISGLTLPGTPVSALGLAVERQLIQRLHAFVAVDVSGENRVYHAIFDQDLATATPLRVGDSYDASSPQNYPQAAMLGSAVWGAWINGDGTISARSGLRSKTFGKSGLRANTLALLGSSDDQPAVLFTANQRGVFVQGEVQAEPVAIAECEPRAGLYLSSLSASLGQSGVWLTGWTKFGEGANGFLGSDSRAVACVAGTCGADTANNCAATLTNGVRNSALTTFMRANDVAGVMYFAAATPSVGLDNGELKAQLALALSRVDVNAKPPVSKAVGTPVSLAAMTTSAPLSFRGPDWPALANVGEKLAVAWIQPDSAGTGTELHIRRYHICFDDGT